MQWQNKDIADLTDSELNAAITKCNWMAQFRDNKLNDPRAEKKFKNQPTPQINPAFIQLKNELESEKERRNTNV